MQYEQFNAGQRKLHTANIKNHISQNKIVFNILLKIYCKRQIKIQLFFQIQKTEMLSIKQGILDYSFTLSSLLIRITTNRADYCFQHNHEDTC